ncbi:MAG TPA: hypothetical protein VFM18_24660, partial [Methanosarcina sp.]|nr:hypothetical protein [Methanosarcina sp.]
MKYNTELKKLKNLVSSDTWDILVASNAIIAGGAITSVFCNREVNDIDVYFRNEEDFITFIEEVYSGSYTLIANNMTNRSILFKDRKTEQDVQVICYKWFPHILGLFVDYDFTINMGALDCSNEEFLLGPQFLKHNAQRYLSFNEGTAYPLISALRVNKYLEKGYTISKAQMLRILLTINAKNIDSWETLKDEIGGMYGLDMNEVFDETKEFNLHDAIKTLDYL